MCQTDWKPLTSGSVSARGHHLHISEVTEDHRPDEGANLADSLSGGVEDTTVTHQVPLPGHTPSRTRMQSGKKQRVNTKQTKTFLFFFTFILTVDVTYCTLHWHQCCFEPMDRLTVMTCVNYCLIFVERRCHSFIIRHKLKTLKYIQAKNNRTRTRKLNVFSMNEIHLERCTRQCRLLLVVKQRGN